MSAKALAISSFESAIEQTVATGQPAPEKPAAELQFREDLWREYLREATAAGLSATQATEYASALSSPVGLVAGVSEMAPVGRHWFYQSQPVVARRTITSGLIRLTRQDKRKATGRTVAAGASRLARDFRWWNAERRS